MSSGRIPSIEGGIQPTIFDAKADILTATAADTPARLAVGANDTVLMADSSTATGLKWGTVSGGGYTLLSTTTLSGASTTISSISQSYKHLLIYVYGVTNATSNGGTRIAPNGDTTLCDFMSSTVSAGTSMSTDGRLQLSGSEEVLRTDANNVTQMMIWNYSSTTFVKAVMWSSGYVHPTDGKRACTAGGQYKSNSAISSLVFTNYGGNFSTGTVLLYGVS